MYGKLAVLNLGDSGRQIGEKSRIEFGRFRQTNR